MTLLMRHRQSWQDAMRIQMHRSDLLKYIYAVGKKMGIHVDTPPSRRILYQGGELDHGHVVDYKKNLMKSTNILSRSWSTRGVEGTRQQSEPRDVDLLLQT